MDVFRALRNAASSVRRRVCSFCRVAILWSGDCVGGGEVWEGVLEEGGVVVGGAAS